MCITPCARLSAAFAFCLILSACGNGGLPGSKNSSAPNTGTDLGSCDTDVATDATRLDAIVPDKTLVEARQRIADEYGGGFRIAANEAELGYIHRLADELRKMGASEVTEEPYTFSAWTADADSGAKLQVLNGGLPTPLKVAYYIPSSGSTGPNGLDGELLYLPELVQANFVSALYSAIAQQNPSDIPLAVQSVLQGTLSGGVSLVQLIASANVRGKIVMYDAPKIAVPMGVFEAISVYYNDSSGTLGPATPYTRPFVNELVLIGAINKALAEAGAVGIVSVLDYPPAAADNSYVPFGGLAIPSVPGIYLDRDTGASLKQQISAATITPLKVRLTLDAQQNDQAVSYNLSALVPGACDGQIVISSHTDGPNSIEDNGPAAMLSIADYFLHAPASQRRRGLKLVFSGGHLVGSPGLNAYIAAHADELKQKALTVIEIEHLGAREWDELSPGAMGLDGLPEPLVLYAGLGSVQQDENVKFAKQFDRTVVTIPLPFGEGGPWAGAGLPKTQIISGPVYLLNGPMPQVSDEFTDYDLEQRQIAALIQMILNLNTQTSATLLKDSNFPNL